MSALAKIMALLHDPPPEFAFEIAADGITMSRTRPPVSRQHVALAPGVIEPSPVRENVLDPAAFAAAVGKLIPAGGGSRRRNAALILPDNAVRIAVLDFDTLPEKEEERRSLINFRLRKSVPFDIDEAALAYFPQAGLQQKAKSVVVALAPAEIVAHYEAPFRAAGLHPGLVTVSSLAMLEMLPAKGSLLVVRRSPGMLTIVALNDGVVTIARSLELASGDSHEVAVPDVSLPDVSLPDVSLEEISAAIYPTMAYIEDQSGARPGQLFITGFGTDSAAVAARFSAELEVPVEALFETSPGLAGYLASLQAGTAAKAAA